jgi:hypothetical protein
MPLTIPKPLVPILIKPIVPGWLLVAALIAQYAVMATDGSAEPSCNLELQRVHKSTYMREFKNQDVIKLNMFTECNVPQEDSEITASILEELPNGNLEKVHDFSNILRRPSPDNPNVTVFKDLTVPCSEGKVATYTAVASGQVKLKSGEIVTVESKKLKSKRTNCKIVRE